MESGSGMMMDMENFSCGNTDLLSSTNVTNLTFWKVDERNQVGAIISGVLVLLFFIVGFVWNLFIIITYLVKHQLLKEPGNVFLINLAITDVIVCITTMIFTFVTAFGGNFLFGNTDRIRCAMCGFSGFFLDITILVSLHLLSALSFDRFLHLFKPLQYSKIMNQKRAVAICICIYILCFALAIPPLIGFGEIEFNARFASCVPRFSPRKNLFYAVFVAIEMIIPITVLGITSFSTFRLIRVFLKKNFRRRSIYGRKGREKEDQTRETSKHQKQQIQLAKVFGALFIANIISYTPIMVMVFVVLVLEITGSKLPPSEAYTFAFISYLTNPVIHPIVESFFVKDLRYEVTRAKKGIRRASTILYRQTTQLMNSLALDEANKKMDAEENAAKATPNKNGTSKQHNGNPPAAPCESMITEMESMPNSRSASPQNESHNSSIAGRSGSAANGQSERRKTRQSVTFQESTLAEVQEQALPMSTSKSQSKPKPDGKAALLAMSSRKIAVQEEADKVAKNIPSSSSSSPS